MEPLKVRTLRHCIHFIFYRIERTFKLSADNRPWCNVRKMGFKKKKRKKKTVRKNSGLEGVWLRLFSRSQKEYNITISENSIKTVYLVLSIVFQQTIILFKAVARKSVYFVCNIYYKLRCLKY